MSYKSMFFETLFANLREYVSDDFSVSEESNIFDIPADCRACQNFYGEYNSLSGIYGDNDALMAFGSLYAKFDIEDDIRDEILGDFLNLHNGLMAVKLSNELSVECTLTVPAMLPNDETKLYDNTYSIECNFPFGKVSFFISEP